MITAAEFYSKRTTSDGERRSLEERIERAAQFDEEELLDALGIVSPFDTDYEISQTTSLWLEKYGWELEEGHIRAIKGEERYIP